MAMRTTIQRLLVSGLLAVAFASCNQADGPAAWNNPLDAEGGNWHLSLSRVADTTLSASKTLYQVLSATDSGSTISGYAWDTASSGFSHVTSSLALANPSGGVETVRWEVYDFEGRIAYDTFTASFVPAPTIASMLVDSELSSWDSSDSTGTIAFSWNGSIDGFAGEPVTWTLSGGSSGTLAQMYSGTATQFSLAGVRSGVSYSYRLTARNRFGDSAAVSGAKTTIFAQPSATDGWNTAITYGTLTDGRDGQTYWTVKIGTQTWMAQNLNYRNPTGSSDTVGVCYSFANDSCAKYGRLYTWAEAMGASSTYATATLGATLPHQGICPNGWRIPSDEEWSVLVQYVDSATSRSKLRSVSGWSNDANGTDAFGFHVLPSGVHHINGMFYNIDVDAAFWTAAEISSTNVWNRGFYANTSTNVTRDNNSKSYGFSLRCLEN
jgi:uncharacterized protein (TIGR02145 family)